MSRQFEESMGGSDWRMMGDASASIDVADHGEEYVVTADLPGFDTDDIDVSIHEDTLRIEAEHHEEAEEREGEGGEGEAVEGESDEARYLRQERRHQSVSRSVTLPERVDEETVSATYRNGVLTVTLPKMAEHDDESHHIDIS